MKEKREISELLDEQKGSVESSEVKNQKNVWDVKTLALLGLLGFVAIESCGNSGEKTSSKEGASTQISQEPPSAQSAIRTTSAYPYSLENNVSREEFNDFKQDVFDIILVNKESINEAQATNIQSSLQLSDIDKKVQGLASGIVHLLKGQSEHSAELQAHQLQLNEQDKQIDTLQRNQIQIRNQLRMGLFLNNRIRDSKERQEKYIQSQ